MSERVLPRVGGPAIRVDGATIAFVVLLLACCLTRLLQLGDRAIMHDEALFTYYSYDFVYRALTYTYLPILHGPAHLLLNGLVWHIFGVTDDTMRLQVALLGIGGFFWIWSLRDWLGRVGIWVALTFYVLSPGITFFQRFYREDGLFLFTTLWIVASAAWWWRSRRPAWLVSFMIACTVLFCNKESSLFVYFSLFTYLLLLVFADVSKWLFDGKDGSIPTATLLEPAPRMPNPMWFATGLFAFVVLCVTRIFEGIKYDADVVEALRHDFVLANVRSIPLMLGWMDPVADAGPAGTAAFWRMFYGGLLLGLAVVFLKLKVIADARVGHREFVTRLWARVHEARWEVLGAAGICFATYIGIFTTLFTNPMGPFEIYKKTWAYWGGQHEWGRISGPFHLHSVNLLVYEMPSVAIVLAAWVFAFARLRWTRSFGVAVLLMALPAAAFHVFLFRGVEVAAGKGGELVPAGIGYLKTFMAGCLAMAALLLARPSWARVAAPVAVVVFALYSIHFFESAEWFRYLTSPVFRNGTPVEMLGGQVTGAQFMEIQWNFDAGWNLWYVFTLVIAATMLSWAAIERGERFMGFLVWWFVTSLGAASYAREAVPQVGIHAALPMILLAGVYADKLWRHRVLGGARALWITLFALFIAWNAKATLNLNFRNGNDVRERMVYAPTGLELKRHAEVVTEYLAIAAIRNAPVPRQNGDSMLVEEWIEHYNDRRRQKQARILIRSEASIWQLRWYLRDVDFSEFETTQTAVDQGWEFLFLDPAELENVPAVREKYHTFLGRGRMFWVPRPLSVDRLTDIWLTFVPKMYVMNTDLDPRLQGARREWRKLWRYLWYREIFDGGGDDVGPPSVSASYYYFCVRRDLTPALPVPATPAGAPPATPDGPPK